MADRQCEAVFVDEEVFANQFITEKNKSVLWISLCAPRAFSSNSLKCDFRFMWCMCRFHRRRRTDIAISKNFNENLFLNLQSRSTTRRL